MRRALLALGLAGCSVGSVVGGATPASVSAAPAGVVGATSTADGDLLVPDLVGRTREEAAELVAAAGFTSGIESSRPVVCEGAPEVEGRINCQSPPAGAAVRPYTTIQINVYQRTRIAGAIVRDELLALIGMTPDDARAALAGYGHDGLVRVEMTMEPDAECAQDRVCGFDVPESGMGVHDAITFYINPPED